MYLGLVWLTSSHMFGSGDFWDESPLWFLKTFKLPSFYLGNFKIFKKALGQYIPNRPRVFVRNDFTCKVVIFRYLYDFSSFWSALVSLKNGSNSSTIVVGGNRHILKIGSMTVHLAYCWSIRAIFLMYLWV